MTFHVLTPFSRWFNLIEMGDCLKRQGVQWHLLLDEGAKTHDLGSWVHQYEFPPPPPDFFVGHWMINQFLEKVGVNDDDYYIVLTDDDFTEPGFFKKVEGCTEDIVIVSMQRGHPPTVGIGAGPFDTLMASPSNLMVGSVGFEQLVIKGRILKQYRLDPVYHADGLLIIKLYQEHADKFRFVQDALVYFNYLPPGRYQCGRWEGR